MYILKTNRPKNGGALKPNAREKVTRVYILKTKRPKKRGLSKTTRPGKNGPSRTSLKSSAPKMGAPTIAPAARNI